MAHSGRVVGLGFLPLRGAPYHHCSGSGAQTIRQVERMKAMSHRRTIRVIQCGLGPIGLMITRLLTERPGVRIAGAVDVDAEKIGRDAGTLAGRRKPLGVTVKGLDDLDALLRQVQPAVAVVATTSSFENAFPLLLRLVTAGVGVVSTCEELAFPWETHPRLAKRLDAAARAKGVAVLGTGVNPGFLMDFLPLALTGVCREVRSIRVERYQDAAFRRLPFQRKIGAGLTPAEFRRKVAEGTLRHVGLTESMRMIAARLGWKLERAQDAIRPVIATRRVATPRLTIEKGRALGVEQTGRAWANGREVITLAFRACVGQPEPRDRVVIEGTPRIDATLAGGVNGDEATCAIVANAIPAIVGARPGLRTMADMDLVCCSAVS